MSTNGKMMTSQMARHATMTELNHLGYALQLKPEIWEEKVNQLFSSKNYYSNNPMQSICYNTGAKKVVMSDTWEWKLSGASTRPLVVIENVELASNLTPGIGKTPFKIKLDESWYQATDVITPGTSGQKYQCRVMETPIRHGNGWVYTVRLVSDDFKAFVPPNYLEAGQQWGKLYSTAEEGSNQDGSTQYAMPMTFSDRLGKFRKEYAVTDYAMNSTLAVKMQDSNGMLHEKWVSYAEVEYWKQWYNELEKAYWYSRSSKSIEGSTGRPVDTFSGIQQKLEDSHVHYYSVLSARLIEEFLMDIFYARIKPGSDRKIKCFTGEYGMRIFNMAMQDMLDKHGWVIANNNFNPIEKTTSEYHSNAYSIGYQFVTYKMQNGAELELVHCPLYDDRTINYEIDPITGYPVESMRFTFLDFSNEGGGQNIKLVEREGGYKFGYVNGLISPTGPVQGGQMSNSREAYSMHVSKQIGVHIGDITRCGELILKRTF